LDAKDIYIKIDEAMKVNPKSPYPLSFKIIDSSDDLIVSAFNADFEFENSVLKMVPLMVFIQRNNISIRASLLKVRDSDYCALLHTTNALNDEFLDLKFVVTNHRNQGYELELRNTINIEEITKPSIWLERICYCFLLLDRISTEFQHDFDRFEDKE